MKLLFWLVLPLLFSCSHAPIQSTVDAYGEIPIQKSDPHFFIRDTLPLQEKQIADSCKAAAMAEHVQVSDTKCDDCHNVLVRSRIAGTAEAIHATPGFGTAVGTFGGPGFGDVGYNSGSVSSEIETERFIEIIVYSDANLKTPARSIVIRSIGDRDSVAAVAYEMCRAAFRDYPQNLKGKTYEVQPQEKQK